MTAAFAVHTHITYVLHTALKKKRDQDLTQLYLTLAFRALIAYGTVGNFVLTLCITLASVFQQIASSELKHYTHIRHYCGLALPPSKGVHLLVFHAVTFSLEKK